MPGAGVAFSRAGFRLEGRGSSTTKGQGRVEELWVVEVLGLLSYLLFWPHGAVGLGVLAKSYSSWSSMATGFPSASPPLPRSRVTARARPEDEANQKLFLPPGSWQ